MAPTLDTLITGRLGGRVASVPVLVTKTGWPSSAGASACLPPLLSLPYISLAVRGVIRRVRWRGQCYSARRGVMGRGKLLTCLSLCAKSPVKKTGKLYLAQNPWATDWPVRSGTACASDRGRCSGRCKCRSDPSHQPLYTCMQIYFFIQADYVLLRHILLFLLSRKFCV